MARVWTRTGTRSLRISLEQGARQSRLQFSSPLAQYLRMATRRLQLGWGFKSGLSLAQMKERLAAVWPTSRMERDPDAKKDFISGALTQESTARVSECGNVRHLVILTFESEDGDVPAQLNEATNRLLNDVLPAFEAREVNSREPFPRFYSEKLISLLHDCNMCHDAQQETSTGWLCGGRYVEFSCPMHGLGRRWTPELQPLIVQVLQEARDAGIDIEVMATELKR